MQLGAGTFVSPPSGLSKQMSTNRGRTGPGSFCVEPPALSASGFIETLMRIH